MQTAKILQTVALMFIIALAASCAASKEYGSKLFAPRNAPERSMDSTTVALRFLDLDTAETDKANWVSTDAIMGRDTSNSTTVLDNFSKSFPAAAKKDSVAAPKEKELTESKAVPILTDAKTPVKSEPVAKSYDPTEVRSKKTRADK